MSQAFLRLIQSGATADVAAAVANDPGLVANRDSQGVSALMWAIYTGQTIVRDYLMVQLHSQGIELDVFEAAATGSMHRLDMLLGEEAVLDLVSGDGWTPLHLAAAFGTPAAVALLLARGAQVNAVSANPQRNQPLHAALALSRNAETIALLLAHGADADAIQTGGFTPLFSAAAANRQDLAELLLRHGARADHRSDQGKTAADFAGERGHIDLAAWLQQQSA